MTARRGPAVVVEISTAQRETRAQTLERLYADHEVALRKFLAVRMGFRNDLDDIVQEVFARMARIEDLHRRLPPGDRRARSYLLVVANNVVITLERRKQLERRYTKQHAELLHSLGPASSPSAESVAFADIDYGRAKRIVLRLRPSWRRAFLLSRLRLMSNREIAEVMGVRVATVEKYIHFALRELRRQLLESPGGGA